uniref:Uncharacterized protein n=1 Tax=Minutocellus polymorphus TaxID=265543 RepID=A0A7S0FH40_9STRA|mmetsp:Transcript_1204/g.2088  ORF Transcript_1204/g.2088 Transcript_1204/m.2088 type:complete len:217 (+) Transcript_1204:192-842(+)
MSSSCDTKVDSSGDSSASRGQQQSGMRSVSIQLPAGHVRHTVGRETGTSKNVAGHSKIPDLLDSMSADSEDYCPSLTSVSMASQTTYNTAFSARSGVTMSSLRSDQSGSLMDGTFDDLSDSDESDAEVKCRRRAPSWQKNSLLAAVAASPAVGLHAADGEKGRMLVRSDTMDVVEKSHGTQALTAGCGVPDEKDFANQYLSTLFCGLGEVMGCGGR